MWQTLKWNLKFGGPTKFELSWSKPIMLGENQGGGGWLVDYVWGWLM